LTAIFIYRGYSYNELQEKLPRIVIKNSYH